MFAALKLMSRQTTEAVLSKLIPKFCTVAQSTDSYINEHSSLNVYPFIYYLFNDVVSLIRVVERVIANFCG
jgi:hypothetical protein